jgi:hypothetical protein
VHSQARARVHFDNAAALILEWSADVKRHHVDARDV